MKVDVRQRTPQRVIENLKEGGERILVHDIDGRHLRQDEEEHSSSPSGWSVSISENINFLGCDGGQFEFLRYLEQNEISRPVFCTVLIIM